MWYMMWSKLCQMSSTTALESVKITDLNTWAARLPTRKANRCFSPHPYRSKESWRWLVPSRLPWNLSEENVLWCFWHQKHMAIQSLQVEESRGPTATDQALLPSGRSESIRRLRHCLFISTPSRGLCVRLHKFVGLICASKVPQWWPCRRRVRLILYNSLKMQTSALSMPSVSPSCQRTCSWQEGLAGKRNRFLPQVSSIK